MRYRCLTLAVLYLAGWSALPAAEPPKKGDATPGRPASASADPKDWPTYNCDVLGWRLNAGETALSRANVGRHRWGRRPDGKFQRTPRNLADRIGLRPVAAPRDGNRSGALAGLDGLPMLSSSWRLSEIPVSPYGTEPRCDGVSLG